MQETHSWLFCVLKKNRRVNFGSASEELQGTSLPITLYAKTPSLRSRSSILPPVEQSIDLDCDAKDNTVLCLLSPMQALRGAFSELN